MCSTAEWFFRVGAGFCLLTRRYFLTFFYSSMFDKKIDNIHLFIAKLVEKTVLTPVSKAFQSSIVQVPRASA